MYNKIFQEKWIMQKYTNKKYNEYAKKKNPPQIIRIQ